MFRDPGLKIASACAILLCFLLCSCPPAQQQQSAGTNTASSSSNTTGGGTTASTPGGQSAAGGNAGTQPASEGEAEEHPTIPAEPDDSKQPLPDKIPESEHEQHEEDTRPRDPEPTKGSKYRIDCEFTSARFNNAPDAELALLEWEAIAKFPDFEFVAAKMKADDPQDEPKGVLDLGWCTAEVEVYIPDPQVTSVRGQEIADYTYFGEYVITMKDPKGAVLAMVKMTSDNELDVNFMGPRGDSGSEYSIVGHFDRSTKDINGYDVFRHPPGDGKRIRLFRIHYRSGGYTTLDVSDVMTNSWIYRYPAGRLEITLFEEP
jgi:hypothetical protein